MFTIATDESDDGAWGIFRRVLEFPELAELRDMMDGGITVAIMMRAGEWTKSQRTTLGICCIPSVQGELRPLFEQLLEDTLGYYPDFLIILNTDWWAQAGELQREALVVHEALHAGQAKDQYGSPKFNRMTGLPVTCIRPHSIEEFNEVVARYGAWKSDVAGFLEAAESGQRRTQAPAAEDVF